jgi:DNA-binding NarL/FixJ family response regulator
VASSGIGAEATQSERRWFLRRSDREKCLNRRPKGLRIFIAAHHDLDRRGLRSVLGGRREWKVCGESTTTDETIEKVRPMAPDLLLLDLTMPNIDVAKVIPQIIELCPSVKIVALASQGSGELAANALALGAKGLALKSEPATVLRQAVQSVGSDQPFLSPAAIGVIQKQLANSKTAIATPVTLTERELEVLRLLARGLSSKEIAGTLGIAVKTVNAHRGNIMTKLHVHGYRNLVQFAIHHGIV